ncbi:hypothetical protein PAE9249_03316 [Paenibacillus sp. CECT 9249]|uniref:DL-endopeptidase inhibitor IseA family protein n=1 Tax=Paenibacillus sp. CECT 9249 TaxID=2845385 RepID=UPI001E2C3384|nr:DL-endopeptidase inhibitor IseA family protein [Paenibacillus sp. CECT 9249]CAH0120793.1 hypothetical protein PAE9249_03316 [Paenibacillus sp. CECT 9249]
MKKHWLSITTAMVIASVVAGTVFANNPIKLIVDGNVIKTSSAPENIRNHVMVPVKSLGEIIGAKVTWDAKRQAVLIDTGKEEEKLRIEQLEKALAPHSAKEAAESFITSYKTRNGALLHAILAPDIRDKRVADEGGWVIGVSSPWVSSAAIQSEKQVNATTAEFLVNFQMATSEGSEGPWLLKVIVKKFDDQWLITDYGDATDSKEQPLSFNKPNQKLDNETVIRFAAEAQKRYWHISDGGRMPDGPVSTFKPEGSELNYRFFGEDLNTKEKLLAYLEEIYTKEASEKFVQDKLNGKSIIEIAGKLAQVDADAGSQLFWKDATVVSSTKPNEQTNVTYTLKVPVGEDGFETKTISFVYSKEKGWRLSNSPEAIR